MKLAWVALVLAGCAVHSRAYVGVVSDRDGTAVQVGVMGGLGLGEKNAGVVETGLVDARGDSGLALGFDYTSVPVRHGYVGWRAGVQGTLTDAFSTAYHHAHVALSTPVARELDDDAWHALSIGLEGQIGSLVHHDSTALGGHARSLAFGAALTFEYTSVTFPTVHIPD